MPRLSLRLPRAAIAAFLMCSVAAPQSAAAAAMITAYLAPEAVAQFYSLREGKPAWASNERYDDLIRAIESLVDHGLDPMHYNLQALRDNRDMPAQREKFATDAWFAAGSHLLYGKLNPLNYEPDWTAARRERDLGSVLNGTGSAESLVDSFNTLAPPYPEYAALSAELVRLRRLQEAPFEVIPGGPILRVGRVGPLRIDLLQTRLAGLGLLPADAMPGVFDLATEAAVKAFQQAEGLKVDGLVGPDTLHMLNLSIPDRIRQVRVNLERWRWLPEVLGRRHIRANIADFSVAAYADGERERTHAIVVGQEFRKTPVFSDEIEYVVLNPWWETPPSLARKDKLPMFKSDPAAVERLGFKVIDSKGRQVAPDSIDWASLNASDFPYRLRQAPGPLNALGRIKIMFPNKHSVYIHDTPTQGLFAQRQRAFSSGCLRTQNPVDLAAWLFTETPGWDKTRFDTEIATGKEAKVNLKSPIPVHILYFTVISDGSGVPRYVDDIYDRDNLVFNGLLKPGS